MRLKLVIRCDQQDMRGSEGIGLGLFTWRGGGGGGGGRS